MSRRGGFEPDVITPAKPGITFEDVAHFCKRRGSLARLVGLSVINAQINQRVRLGFEHMILPTSFQALLIVFQCSFKILQLTMNPAYAIRHAWKPELIP